MTVQQKLESMVGANFGIALDGGNGPVVYEEECDCTCPIPDKQIVPVVIAIANS